MKRCGVVKGISILGISMIIMSFQASAQSADNSDRPSRDGNLKIRSTTEYHIVQDSIEVLAYELYTVYQRYPKVRYKHQFDAQGRLTGISVTGVRDKETAGRVSSHLMKLEILGEAIRTMDRAYLPDSNMPADFGRLSQKETLRYVPVPKAPKDNRVLTLDQKAIL
jgi:hypothetical protein